MAGLPDGPGTSATTTSDAQPPTLANMGTASDPSMPSDEVFNMDPDGDLLLDVKPDDQERRKRFRVCSATLRRHSPVWKTMLFGPWKEAKPTDDSEWVVELPEDPAFPMAVILYIIHGLFDYIPQELDVESLFGILVITNKYDMTRVVKPWCAQWMLPAEPTKLGLRNTVRSLFIAWELGNESLFITRLAEIALNTWFGMGVLVFQRRKAPLIEGISLEAEDYLGPPDISATISAIRRAVIDRMINPVHEDLEIRMGDNPYCSSENAHRRQDKRLCDASIIGAIHRSMVRTKGSMLPRTSSVITESASQMVYWLYPLMTDIPTLDDHEKECSLVKRYKDHVTKWYDSMPVIVQEFLKPSHLEYMASQRKKTGLESYQGKETTQRYWKTYGLEVLGSGGMTCTSSLER